MPFGAPESDLHDSAVLHESASSCIVCDPKLESAWITAPYRRSIGQRVVILDPWNEANEKYGSQVGVTETMR